MSVSFAKNGGTTSTDQKPGINVPKTNKTSSQIEDILIRARVEMLMKAPFFGNLATRLRLVDATEWCPTAATDGKYFYYNRDFTAALQEDEVIWLMGHEIMHCVYDHMDPDRRGSRIPMLWNISNDHVINLELEQAKLGRRIRKEIIEVCYDTKFAEKTSEEIYDEIFKDLQKQGRIKYVEMDMHLDRQPGDDPGASSDGSEEGKTGPAKMTQEEKEQAQQDFQNAVVQSAKAAGGAGNLPGGVRRMLDKLLNPQLDWRELLAMQIQSTVRSDYTWMRPSRKGMDSGIYLPSMDREQTIDIAVCIDTSGSISGEMLRDFLSEIHGIMSQYTDFTLKLWCFDTAVHNPVTFTAENVNDLMEYEIQGFGGTEFMVNWDFMKAEGFQPKKLVMFTDGYPFGSWGDESYCDTLFIVHGGRSNAVPEAPFGLTVPYTSLES
jgi:predicted metal-dependent peptidase